MSQKRAKVYSIKKGNANVPIYRSERTKKGKAYFSYTVCDYGSGKRKFWTFADLAEAKRKAEDIADGLINGYEAKSHGLTYRVEIQQALEAVAPTGVSILRAAELFKEAVAVLGGHEQLLSACAYWKSQGLGKGVEAKTVNEAVKAYLVSRQSVSHKRLMAETSYFTGFKKSLGDKHLHEVTGPDVEDFVKSTKWGPKTTNDFLTTLHGLYKHGQGRRWVLPDYDASKHVKRRKEPRNAVVIFEPWEVRQIFNRLVGIRDELIPFLALWFFAGIRKEEIGRMTWPQVNRALVTGWIELEARQTKTQTTRNVPLTQNLKTWLTAFKKESGTIMPAQWLEKTQSAQNRLSEITRLIQKVTGIKWKYNGPRHSYATFAFKKLKDAGPVVDAMGTSLAKFERHYRSKSNVVTEQAAAEYFEIAPGGLEKIVPLPTTERSLAPLEKQAASGAVAVNPTHA